MRVDDAVRLAEIEAAFDDYERALTTNDVEALDRLFWNSPKALRFGATENLFGYDAIQNFRSGRSPSGLARKVLDRQVTCFGDDFAVANITFRRDGEPRIGRQSQAWARMPEGWRIVAAHVSWMDMGRQ
jgi:ketosteroid isomerase-like protein